MRAHAVKLSRTQALAQIVESATVTDGSGNVVDLKNLHPDGTLGDPADVAESEGESEGEAEVEAQDSAEG